MPTPSNKDYAWDEFDPDAYVAQYYAGHSPDDDLSLKLSCSALRAAAERAGPLDVVDVGTGPSLIALLAALPFARSITSWEFGTRNVEWLRAQIAAPQLSAAWRHYWDVMQAQCAADFFLPEDPTAALAAKATIHQGSIFDLPERNWTAATMFFCANPITRDQDEFRRACGRFARSVSPGGALVAAFLARSSGYDVADRAFPAVAVSEDDIHECFAELAADVVTQRIGKNGDDIQPGYSGMVFLTAQAR